MRVLRVRVPTPRFLRETHTVARTPTSQTPLPPPKRPLVPIDYPRQGAKWHLLASPCCSAGSLFPHAQLLSSQRRREGERKRAAQVRLRGSASLGAPPGSREWEGQPLPRKKRHACPPWPGIYPYTPLPTPRPQPRLSFSAWLWVSLRSVPPPSCRSLPLLPSATWALCQHRQRSDSARKRRGGQLRAMAEPSRTADPLPRGKQ